MLVTLAVLVAAGCARGRIEGRRYVSPRTGYQLRLPGPEWAAAADGWKHRWELGYRIVLVEETYKYVTRRRERIVQGRRVLLEETVREVDQPARVERRDVFRVDTAFAHKGRDIRIIVATARLGDLLRYLRDGGARPDPQDSGAIARAYFRGYPSFLSHEGEYRLTPDGQPGPSTLYYLELLSGQGARTILAGRLLGDRLVVAYYRARGDIPLNILGESRRQFRALAGSIQPYP